MGPQKLGAMVQNLDARDLCTPGVEDIILWPAGNLTAFPGPSAYNPVNVHSCLVDSSCSKWYDLFSHGAPAPGGLEPLIIKTLRSHSDTPHSVRLLWTSDQSDAETSTW